jgi:DNA-binding IclR family transcriptional regulator
MSVRKRILEILEAFPNGLTAKEVAERSGATMGKISSPLSKLVAYGLLKKTQGKPQAVFSVRHINANYGRERA